MIHKIQNAQGAIEFLIIFGAVLGFFVVFFAIIQENITDKNIEKEKILVKNIALSVQDEINLALRASDGYYREFKVSESLSGKSYDINITSGMVYVKTEKNAIALPVPEIQGNIKKGINKISKQNATIYLNQ